jgi:hypothetical protein
MVNSLYSFIIPMMALIKIILNSLVTISILDFIADLLLCPETTANTMSLHALFDLWTLEIETEIESLTIEIALGLQIIGIEENTIEAEILKETETEAEILKETETETEAEIQTETEAEIPRESGIEILGERRDGMKETEIEK